MSRLRTLVEFYASRPLRPQFDPHERWYTRLVAADDHEAWLLTWLPGQGTDLHDHGGSAGAFTVLAGRLTEQTVGVRLMDRGYSRGATREFGPHHVHRMVNAGTVPAVSLHVYAPALTRMTRYELVDGALRALAVERAGADW
ncbi:MAG: cysteine dioxygenase [Actinobacteria bacterium 13_1_20CM_3_71_11]|nr:MAG: cysteine dioxygenase [Actinobacteria bacterium 13_1_20CM_3_71_11]